MAASLSLSAGSLALARVGYLGPAGSWTHQACLDLFGEAETVPLTREDLFKAFAQGRIESACVPVTTSIVGATPYLDDVLRLPKPLVVAEHPKMLGYSLLARPGATPASIRTVLAHPVALEEVKPWLDQEMPQVLRKPAASAGAAAEEVAATAGNELAAMGPPIAATIYGLAEVVRGIEEGPHNVTRWWVLGRQMPAPTGRDKSTLLLSVREAEFADSLRALFEADVPVLTIYERPGKSGLDSHRYVIDVEGHAHDAPLRRLLGNRREFRLLGSYPRRY